VVELLSGLSGVKNKLEISVGQVANLSYSCDEKQSFHIQYQVSTIKHPESNTKPQPAIPSFTICSTTSTK